jgi:hypothetical protein
MIGIGEKIVEKNDLKKSKSPSVYRGKMAISPTLLPYILLWFLARDMDREEGGPIFLPKYEHIDEPICKLSSNIKSLALSPS